MAQQGPLSRARDVGDFVYATPDAAKYLGDVRGALNLGGFQGSSAAEILDGAAGRLMDEYVPDMANRAAGAGAFTALGEGKPGSLAAAIGGGMTGRLNADLSRLTTPIRMEGEAAGALLQREQAKQAELQNQINALNFGYLTEPLPGIDGNAPAGGTPAGGGGSDNLTGEGDLPLTPQTQLQLEALKSQLRRALKFAYSSPQARADAYKIYDDMAKAVQEDPLAKNELLKRQAQEKSNIDIAQHGQTNEQDFAKGVQESVVKMTQEAQAQATDEFHAMAANPNYSRQLPNLNNPAAVDTFVRNRARAILAQKYAELEAQLKGMGLDPRKYLGAGPGSAEPATTPAEVAPAEEVPPAAPGQEIPIPRVGATVQPTAPGDPTTPTAPTTEENAFVPAGLLPGEALDYNKEQEVAAGNANLLAQGIQSLEKGLTLNDKSLEGALSGMEEWVRRAKLGIRNLGRGEKEEDVVLNNTAELNSILSSGVLQNLSTLIKGNPTEGERAYVERLGATINKSKGERRVLMQRALELLRPRLAFENMRQEALAHNRPIRWTDYEAWLKWAYGDAIGEQIRKGDFGDGG